MIYWLRRYAAHPDPATAAVNLIALVVASNGPFYPIYTLAIVGRDHPAAWLTMLSSPFFALVPLASHHRSTAGRAALPLIGIVNTLWCTELLGSASRVDLFLLPCIALTSLQFRADERRLMLCLLGFAIGALICLMEFPLDGLMHLSAGQQAALARLNAISVATLGGFLALTQAKVLRQSGTTALHEADSSRITPIKSSPPP